MEETAVVWSRAPNAATKTRERAQRVDDDLFSFSFSFLKSLFWGSVGNYFFFFFQLVASSWRWKLLSADSRVRLGSASGEVGKPQPSERWKTSPWGERHYKALMEDDLSPCSCPHVLTDVGARCSFIALLREARPRAWIYSARGQGT